MSDSPLYRLFWCKTFASELLSTSSVDYEEALFLAAQAYERTPRASPYAAAAVALGPGLAPTLHCSRELPLAR